MKDNRPRFKTPEARALMALVLALDPTVAPELRHMFRKGVRNIRFDHMSVLNHQTGKYDYLPDPCAWMGDINQHVGIMLLKGSSGVDRNHPDAKWWLNGF
jgi:hypothetical protein